MNILFVADVSISETISGSERVLFEQSTRLQRRGHNVHILTRKLPDHKSDQETINGVREWRYDVNQKNSFSFIKSILVNCKELFESLQDQFSFNCINFHQPFSAFAVTRSPVSKEVSKIYTCHSLSFEEFQSRNPRPKAGIKKISYFFNVQARRFIERKILNESDRIVVLSRFTKDRLWKVHEIPSGKVVVIPGGVDLQRFFPAINKMEIRKWLTFQKKR